MKKFIAAAITLVMLFSAFGAFAADIAVTVNGEEVVFDVQPEFNDEKLLLPLRFIFEKMGARVSWYDETNTAFANFDGSDIITIQVDNELMFVNGTEYTLDTAPVLKNDRILVPAAVITNATGATVLYDEQSNTVTIDTTKEK